MKSRALQDEVRQLVFLRVASLLEGGTLIILLFVAVPLKHIAGYPVATSIVGPVHGLAFLFYFWSLIQTVSGGNWSQTQTMRMVLAALIPFGAFFNERLIARRQSALLKGA